MASDYKVIRADNERRYGTDIGRIGPMLLANRYDDRTHFIYELLQNAEDALAKRKEWGGLHSVRFHLSKQELRIRHFGKPFDEADVRGICGILESTKGLTEIGRFGIGFKSVYAYSNRPEVHSGTEDFAIESFVWPVAVTSVPRSRDETVIVIPLKESAASEEIASGMNRLGPGALLFLREIEEIAWSVEDRPIGLYRRQLNDLGNGVRRITVLSRIEGQQNIEQTWLAISKPVFTDIGEQAGHIEVAFFLTRDESTNCERVAPIPRSPLVVFFPTVVETYLGFLVQGPYRTTPSRDNVPHRDPWNRQCVQQTSRLLIDALHWLRKHDLLDIGTLQCLPLDRAKFADNSMFMAFYEATKDALSSEPFLPCFGGGHVPAIRSKLARTQQLRELISAEQLARLFGIDGKPAWLSSDVSQDRTPELRQYLIHELKITEVTPEMILSKLDASFLEAQSDEWVLKLYEFLNGQPGLRRRAEDLPLVRLGDGRHVQSHMNGHFQAFLPGSIETGFPTVRPAVCRTEAARAFLRDLGLTEPDPVDDVVRNILPKYREQEIAITHAQYEADIRRMLTAFSTDSNTQREKLITTLRETPFVMTVNTGDGSKRTTRPAEVYLPTDRLKELFAGVEGVLFVDYEYSCLRGEDVRELLEVCGVTRYLQPIPVKSDLSWEQRMGIRRSAGLERCTWENPISDVTLRGLDALLAVIPQLEPQGRRYKATLLWEAIADVESRRGTRAFLGEYMWGYSHETKTAAFDAMFVRMLNTTEWVPDHDGNLQRPELVLFEPLGWKPNPVLQSKIRFKPPILEQLAKEAGIEPGVLDLLKKHGVTSVAELVARLGLVEEPKKKDDFTDRSMPPIAPGREAATPASLPSGSSDRTNGAVDEESDGRRSHGAGTRGDRPDEDRTKEPGHGGTRPTPRSRDGQLVVSYVGVHPNEEDPDPDGLDQSARMALEAQAIDFIRQHEPNWKTTPEFNRGFDLFETGADEQPCRWCEVKAMTGTLKNRPVGLSRAQFECAREHGADYWLYVVEHANDKSARIVRIQDPAGKARTFTFDHGWINIAELDCATD